MKKVVGVIGIALSVYCVYLTIISAYRIPRCIDFYTKYVAGRMWAGFNYFLYLFIYNLVGILFQSACGIVGIICFISPIKEKRFFISALLQLITGASSILFDIINRLEGLYSGFIVLPFVLFYYTVGVMIKRNDYRIADVRGKLFPFIQMLRS